MQQYLDHLKAILEKGVDKSEAREGLLPTKSLFGYQWRHNLADGFPLLTTKKVYWRGVIVELLWFMSGQTNVKWLNDNGVTFWNEDAYNYYLKQFHKNNKGEYDINPMDFETFIDRIKNPKGESRVESYDYRLGSTGYQYGRLWRDLGGVDQLAELLNGLISNPMSRRHIIDAWNPPTLNKMALHPCHCLVQFNCRPIPWEIKLEFAKRNPNVEMENLAITEAAAGDIRFGFVPQYYLDCQMYQRSADMFLGVPLNIASYALLTEIICKIVNMVPGEMIYTYGDSHIYGNVREEVALQLTRQPKELPRLNINTEFWFPEDDTEQRLTSQQKVDRFLSGLSDESFRQSLIKEDIQLSNYSPHPAINAKDKLLTGVKIVNNRKEE